MSFTHLLFVYALALIGVVKYIDTCEYNSTRLIEGKKGTTANVIKANDLGKILLFIRYL